GARDGERPEVAVEAVAGAHLARVEPRPELLGVCAERHDADVFRQGVEPQLPEHLLRLLAGPLAVGDHRHRGTQQRLEGAPRPGGVMDRVELREDVATVDQHAVLGTDALVRPFGGVGRGAYGVAPGEPRLVLWRQRGAAARPAKQAGETLPGS